MIGFRSGNEIARARYVAPWRALDQCATARERRRATVVRMSARYMYGALAAGS